MPLDKAAILGDFKASDENKRNSWIVSTVTQVEEVKMVISLIPIWSTYILFWTVYSQMNTFTIEQATHMDRKVAGFSIPAGSFSVFLNLLGVKGASKESPGSDSRLLATIVAGSVLTDEPSLMSPVSRRNDKPKDFLDKQERGVDALIIVTGLQRGMLVITLTHTL
ncbi:NRT1/ PTR family 6.4-like protein [Tanacetum coccineum]